jgi:hypothetical protein
MQGLWLSFSFGLNEYIFLAFLANDMPVFIVNLQVRFISSWEKPIQFVFLSKISKNAPTLDLLIPNTLFMDSMPVVSSQERVHPDPPRHFLCSIESVSNSKLSYKIKGKNPVSISGWVQSHSSGAESNICPILLLLSSVQVFGWSFGAVNLSFFKYHCNVWRGVFIHFGSSHLVTVPLLSGIIARTIFWMPLLATTQPCIRILTNVQWI